MEYIKELITKIKDFIKNIFSNELKIQNNSKDKHIKNNIKSVSNSTMNITNNIQEHINDQNRK